MYNPGSKGSLLANIIGDMADLDNMDMQQAMLKGRNNIKGRAVPDGGMIAHPPSQLFKM